MDSAKDRDSVRLMPPRALPEALRDSAASAPLSKRQFICLVCQGVFASKFSMERHIKAKHPGEILEQPDASPMHVLASAAANTLAADLDIEQTRQDLDAATMRPADSIRCVCVCVCACHGCSQLCVEIGRASCRERV